MVTGPELMKVFVGTVSKFHMGIIFDFVDANGNEIKDINESLINRRIEKVVPAEVKKVDGSEDQYRVVKRGEIRFSNV